MSLPTDWSLGPGTSVPLGSSLNLGPLGPLDLVMLGRGLEGWPGLPVGGSTLGGGSCFSPAGNLISPARQRLPFSTFCDALFREKVDNGSSLPQS